MIRLSGRSVGIIAILAALLVVHAVLFFLPPAYYGTYFNIVRPVSYLMILTFAWLCLGRNLRIFQGKKTFILVAVLGLTLYLAFNFIIGLITGFGHNVMSLELMAILRNAWAYIMIIAVREAVRGLVMTRVGESHKYWKMFGIALVFSLVSLDNIGAAVGHNLFAQADWIFTSLLPVVVINIYLTYAALNGGLIGNLIFMLGLNIFVYFSPVLPDIPNILDAIAVYCVTFIMFIIYDSVEWRAKRNGGITVEYKDRRRWWWTILPGAFLAVLIMFGLGVFPIIPVAVASNSMAGEFRRGDIVYVRRIEPNDVAVGDIIQYAHNGISIVHRVVEIRHDTSLGRYFVLKGDENPTPDMWPVLDEQIVGRVRYRTPLIGWPALWFWELR
jgi:signal peptidase